MLKYPCSFCCETFHENRRKPWTKEEDERLIAYIKKHGEGHWRYLPKKAGISRCGKSCRTRWLSCLRPLIHRRDFTHEETQLINNLHNVFGNKWSEIAKRLPGRTDHDIQSYWKTKTIIRKLLNRCNIDHLDSSSDDEDDEVLFVYETKNLLGQFSEIEEEVVDNNPDGEICADLNLDLTIGLPRVQNY